MHSCTYSHSGVGLRSGLWYLTPLSTIFQLFRGGSTFSVWSVYLSFLHETMVHVWPVLARCDKTFSYAILLALKFVASSSDKSKFMICSDSRSCLAIPSCKTQNPFISKIVEIHKSLAAIGKHDICTWTSSLIGIHGTQSSTRKARTHWMILYPYIDLNLLLGNIF